MRAERDHGAPLATLTAAQLLLRAGLGCAVEAGVPLEIDDGAVRGRVLDRLAVDAADR